MSVGPPLARPEQVDQARGLFVGVRPTQRFDADLAAQCDRLNRLGVAGAVMPMRAVSRGVTENCSAATSTMVNVRLLTLKPPCCAP